ncbi:MAG: RluA family pseudouridine synthase [Rhodospirillales bacterium]|nr:RluA family pseudouridine synthase [Rhodospirillales bacterium]
MSLVKTVPVRPEDGELRLDRWFKRHYPGLAHGRLEKLLRTGQIRVDGRRAKASDRLAPGMEVRVPPLGPEGEKPPPPRAEPRPRDVEKLLRAVLYRDEDVIAINKPPGLAVQGGTGTDRHLDMMLDALRFEAAERPRLVHRLDRDTSGVLLLARSPAAAARLAAAFRDKSARKIYWAVVVGAPRPRAGTIDMPLSKRAGAHGERVGFDEEEGRRAVTRYATIESAQKKASWLALWPVTGRTHQLRAHCAQALGTPILGDGKYGGPAAHLAGVPHGRMLHLHARSIELPHPRGGTLRIEAPLPPHMQETWRFFGFAESARDPFTRS